MRFRSNLSVTRWRIVYKMASVCSGRGSGSCYPGAAVGLEPRGGWCRGWRKNGGAREIERVRESV